MTSNWQDEDGDAAAPAAEAVAIILRAMLGNEQVACRHAATSAPYRVFSYHEDFDYLWNFENTLLHTLGTSCRTIVLVWDGVPHGSAPGGVNVFDYLTAFDWIVALALKLDESLSSSRTTQSTSIDRESLQVLILDCAGEQHANSETAELFRRLQNGADPILSWVRTFQPTQIDELLEAVQHPPITNRTKGNLGLLKRLWATTLVKPANAEDRHAIANLIGPRMLLSGMRARNGNEIKTDKVVIALQNLMKAVGLVPELDDSGDASWIDHSDWHELVQRFVLVDDMHELGWEEFLRRAIGIPGDSDQLKVFHAPDRQMCGANSDVTLVNLLVNEDGVLRIGQGISLTGASTEVLFLDLRLFAYRRNEEYQHFERLLELAKQASENTPLLPWPGFSRTELEAVRKCIVERKAESEGYFIALTLLPRLIALVDPRLPIVLFSSTGQKHIVDRLRHCGNIILHFDKPRFFAEVSSDILSNVKNRFLLAFQKALVIARGRKFIGEVLSNYPIVQELESQITPPPQRVQNSQKKLLEFYFDETGDPRSPGFAVGGLAVLYPNHESAVKFSEELRNRGLVWGWDRDKPWKASPRNPLLKTYVHKKRYRKNWKPPFSSTLLKVKALADAHKLEIATFSLAWPGRNLESMHCGAPDYLYRTLLKDTIEILLYEWRQEHCNADDVDVGIYVATRRIPETDPRRSLLTHARRYGLTLREEKDKNARPRISVLTGDTNIQSVFAEVARYDHAYCRDGAFLKLFMYDKDSPASIHSEFRQCEEVLAFSFSHDGVHPLLSDIATERRDKSQLESITCAAAVKLTYYSGSYQTVSKATPHQLPRQIHYVADWVLGNSSLTPEKWLASTFSEVRDQGFMSLLRSCRFAENPGREIDALLEFHRAGRIDRPLRRLALPRASKCASRLSGEQFIRFSERLSSEVAK